MFEAAARLEDLPVDVLGHDGQVVAPLFSVFVRFELEAVEAILLDPLEAEFDCAQVPFEP